MTELAKFIRLNEDGTLSGNIASIAYDIDITDEPFSSTNLECRANGHCSFRAAIAIA
ncbi:hypothetical protein [Rhizobium grahamii]|uniref:Uncharacterized protein n=1 Tax=Rhizobium grahamii CCGE 502 TaxID=990285 RepID=S3ICS8_9HYPH|nr:hypothetical protein [Rhizobium grahamii]EPE96983.1 hypothetical protein RGCCGE502_17470 [Rhizobium grahamii CCGE 502]